MCGEQGVFCSGRVGVCAGDWVCAGCGVGVCGARGLCAGQGCEGHRVLGSRGGSVCRCGGWGSGEVAGRGSVCAGCVWGEGWVWAVSGE